MEVLIALVAFGLGFYVHKSVADAGAEFGWEPETEEEEDEDYYRGTL